jgi:hypothetical protein
MAEEFCNATTVWTGNSYTRDAVTGTLFTPSNVTRNIGQGGWAAKQTAGGYSYIDLKKTVDQCLPNLSAGTVVLYRRKLDTTYRNASAFTGDQAAGNRLICCIPYSDGSIFYDFGNATTNRLTITGVTFTTVPECWVFCVGLRGIEVWRDGIKLGSGALGGARPASSVALKLGSATSSATLSDLVENYIFAVFPCEFTTDQCLRVSKNPYQLFLTSKKIFSLSALGTETHTSTVTGRLGQTAQGTTEKIAVISLLANAGSSGQSVSTKIASQAITGTSGQTAQAASTKIASQAITGISGQAAQAASTKIASQAITGIIGQTGQITAEQIGAGVITTTVIGRFGQAAQSASTKIASQAITGKIGQAAQSASTKIASQAITGKIGQAAQSASTKIASQVITAIIGQAGRTIAAPGGIIIPSIDRGYVVSPENRNYLVSPENRNYSISL